MAFTILYLLARKKLWFLHCHRTSRKNEIWCVIYIADLMYSYKNLSSLWDNMQYPNHVGSMALLALPHHYCWWTLYQFSEFHTGRSLFRSSQRRHSIFFYKLNSCLGWILVLEAEFYTKTSKLRKSLKGHLTIKNLNKSTPKKTPNSLVKK